MYIKITPKLSGVNIFLFLFPFLEVNFVFLFYNFVFASFLRIYQHLGCPHGCGDGIIGAQGDHLRIKGQNCLQQLYRRNPPLFHKFLRDTVKHRHLQETVDFLHAFLGFCIDPTTILQSPLRM